MIIKGEKASDWVQFFVLMGSILGTSYVFYTMTDTRITRMDENHRQDIQKMDEKWERLFGLFVEQIKQQKDK